MKGIMLLCSSSEPRLFGNSGKNQGRIEVLTGLPEVLEMTRANVIQVIPCSVIGVSKSSGAAASTFK